MIFNNAGNNSGHAFPRIGYGANLDQGPVWTPRQGISYRPRFSTGYNSIRVSPQINGTVYNVPATDYLPNRYGGMVGLRNTTGYNPGAGKYILLYNTPLQFSLTFAIELVGINLTSGADIFIGAYNGGASDWWIGLNSSSTIVYSRNGTVTSTGLTGVIGRRYIFILGNEGTGGTGTGFSYFRTYDSAGVTFSGGTGLGADLTTSGIIGIGKYGGWNDNYLSNINVGALIMSNFYVTAASSIVQKNRIRSIYGVTI